VRDRLSTPAEPVGHPLKRNPWGIANMLGSKFEWTNTLGRSYPYSPSDGREDIRASGSRILKGGYFVSTHSQYAYGVHDRYSCSPSDVSCGFSFSPDMIGFRSARSAT
jgi:formylglycine-generating enzyme required for sulfatase activity